MARDVKQHEGGGEDHKLRDFMLLLVLHLSVAVVHVEGLSPAVAMPATETT